MIEASLAGVEHIGDRLCVDPHQRVGGKGAAMDLVVARHVQREQFGGERALECAVGVRQHAQAAVGVGELRQIACLAIFH